MESKDLSISNFSDTCEEENPSPENFSIYLPWAGRHLHIVDKIMIFEIQNTGNKRASAKSKTVNRSSSPSSKSQMIETMQTPHVPDNTPAQAPTVDTIIPDIKFNTVKIYTIHDNSGNLSHLKFENNKNVPITVLKIIRLILRFHIYLTHISINRGINNYCLHELTKWLEISNITDLCLDGTAVTAGCYDMLLAGKNKLRQISLSRCKIDDKTVEKIAQLLIYPQPSSNTLSLLNLASNKITDIGAKCLSVVLRTNRQLVYLNVSDNLITDYGATAILDVLKEFTLFNEEIASSKRRYMEFLKRKDSLITSIVNELKSESFDRKRQKRMSVKGYSESPMSRRGKDELDDGKSQPNFEAWWYEKAKTMAESRMASLRGPFFPEHVRLSNGQIHCYGNNRLAYLNLAYNSISIFTVKKLLAVLLYQKSNQNRLGGLVNVSVEGNPIPSKCEELANIDAILMSCLATANKRLSLAFKKKTNRK